MGRVLVFGAFDVIHPGHLDFLRQARAYGDRLVVSVARDSYIVQHKGRKPIHTEQQRLQYILATKIVNEAYLGDETPGRYSIITRVAPDVICLGYDQDAFKESLLPWLAEHYPATRVVTLEPFRPDIYKSSKLNADAYRPAES